MISFRRQLQAKGAEMVGVVGESIIFMNVFYRSGNAGAAELRWPLIAKG